MKFIKRIFLSKGWKRDLEGGLRALELGKVEEASHLLEKAHRRARKIFSRRDLRLVDTTYGLARLRHAQQNPQGTDLDREVLKIRQKKLGKNDTQTQEALLAVVGNDVYSDVPDRAEVERAVGYAQRLGRNSHQYANICGKLGLFHLAQGETDKGHQLLTTALNECERLYGRDPNTYQPEVAHYLGTRAADLGHLELSLNFLRHAQRLRENRFGARSPEVADVLHQMGQVALRDFNLDKAERYLRKATEFSHQPEIVASLGGCLHACGQLAEAEECYRSYLRHVEDTQGPDSPRVAQSLHYLMTVLHGRGEHAAAEAVRHRILEFETRTKKEVKLEIADRFRVFGHCLGSDPEAEAYLREALRIRSAVLGKKHPGVAQIKQDLAHQLGETRESKKLSKSAGKRLKKAKPDQQNALIGADRGLARQLGYWAHLHLRGGDREKAANLAQRALDLAGEDQELSRRLAEVGQG